MKAANSPRPAAWILERSLDSENFLPWQYYAPSDEECWSRYSTPPVGNKLGFFNDDDVICTSQYSKPIPMENGEVSALSPSRGARKMCYLLIASSNSSIARQTSLFDFAFASHRSFRKIPSTRSNEHQRSVMLMSLLLRASEQRRSRSPTYFCRRPFR